MNTNFKILSLKVVFKECPVFIQFSPEISIIHGEMSTGKSSIARLIYYCFGGDLVYTPALESEFLSATVEAQIGEYEVILERERRTTSVDVAFRKDGCEGTSIHVPINGSEIPIFNEDIFDLRDLLFYFLGVKQIKVHRTMNKESKMVRLGFLDLFTYCYIPQDRIDKSFFKLDNENPFMKNKSIAAIRFIIGHYNDKLSDLELEYSEISNEIMGKSEAVIQLRNFLKEFDYNDEKEISNRIAQLESSKKDTKEQIGNIRSGFQEDTHFVDELRNELRSITGSIDQEEQTLKDINLRTEENESLKAELISTKFKIAKSEASQSLLTGVKFEICPACGAALNNEGDPACSCYLCRSELSEKSISTPEKNDIAKSDLSSRILEINESLELLKRGRRRQDKKLSFLVEKKKELDGKLTSELRNYDSKFLSRSVELERQEASIQTRIDDLKRIVKLPVAVNQLETENTRLIEKRESINIEIEKERKKLNPKLILSELEQTYMELLIATGIKDVSKGDSVSISTDSWRPVIRKNNQEFKDLTFENAGSEGLKTLMNDCFVFAIHIVAERYNLPLPRVILIDSPMSNITRAENEEVMEAFYHKILELSMTTLKNVQIIIIDADVVQIRSDIKAISWMYMSKTDPSHPPLIPYYHG